MLRALASHSIPITLSGEEANITETMLSSTEPFHQVNDFFSDIVFIYLFNRFYLKHDFGRASITSQVESFLQAAHLAVMDSLMIAHMRSIITIDKVVEAVR